MHLLWIFLACKPNKISIKMRVSTVGTLNADNFCAGEKAAIRKNLLLDGRSTSDKRLAAALVA